MTSFGLELLTKAIMFNLDMLEDKNVDDFASAVGWGISLSFLSGSEKEIYIY